LVARAPVSFSVPVSVVAVVTLSVLLKSSISPVAPSLFASPDYATLLVRLCLRVTLFIADPAPGAEFADGRPPGSIPLLCHAAITASVFFAPQLQNAM
jgi:hypothetical protein